MKDLVPVEDYSATAWVFTAWKPPADPIWGHDGGIPGYARLPATTRPPTRHGLGLSTDPDGRDISAAADRSSRCDLPALGLEPPPVDPLARPTARRILDSPDRQHFRLPNLKYSAHPPASVEPPHSSGGRCRRRGAPGERCQPFAIRRPDDAAAAELAGREKGRAAAAPLARRTLVRVQTPCGNCAQRKFSTIIS